jgi:uncharacterized protein YcfL
MVSSAKMSQYQLPLLAIKKPDFTESGLKKKKASKQKPKQQTNKTVKITLWYKAEGVEMIPISVRLRQVKESYFSLVKGGSIKQPLK